MAQEPKAVVWMPSARADRVGVLEDLAEHDPGYEQDLHEDVMRRPPRSRR
jgi:hypothetical protein